MAHVRHFRTLVSGFYFWEAALLLRWVYLYLTVGELIKACALGCNHLLLMKPRMQLEIDWLRASFKLYCFLSKSIQQSIYWDLWKHVTLLYFHLMHFSNWHLILIAAEINPLPPIISKVKFSLLKLLLDLPFSKWIISSGCPLFLEVVKHLVIRNGTLLTF